MSVRLADSAPFAPISGALIRFSDLYALRTISVEACGKADSLAEIASSSIFSVASTSFTARVLASLPSKSPSRSIALESRLTPSALFISTFAPCRRPIIAKAWPRPRRSAGSHVDVEHMHDALAGCATSRANSREFPRASNDRAAFGKLPAPQRGRRRSGELRLSSHARHVAGAHSFNRERSRQLVRRLERERKRERAVRHCHVHGHVRAFECDLLDLGILPMNREAAGEALLLLPELQHA